MPKPITKVKSINGVLHKQCSVCSEWKALDVLNFNRRRDAKAPNRAPAYQFQAQCRPCAHDGQKARKYGITIEEVRRLNQITHCVLCNQPAAHIDHNHVTGKVRERLCSQCNQGLGLFFEDVAVLQRAIEYIEKHR